MKKSDLRIKYTKQRETLSQDEVLLLSEKIFLNFLEKFKVEESQKVHCFLSMLDKKKLIPDFLQSIFFKNQIRVFVPKIFKGKMISVEITPETAFIKSFYGILKPESNLDSGETEYDFVITPLLYCDENGNRVGYGKGFYDQFLKILMQIVLKSELVYFNHVKKQTIPCVIVCPTPKGLPNANTISPILTLSES